VKIPSSRYTSDMDRQQPVFGVKYTDRGAGRIDIILTDGVTDFAITASNVYDPFPGMIDWLESLIHENQSSSWIIDEEDKAVKVTYTLSSATDGSLYVADIIHQERQIAFPLAIRTLVATFYEAFRKFIESPRYNSDDWEELTLGEYLSRQAAMPEAQLRRQLSHYPARALQQLSWHILPQYEMLCPEGMTEWMGITEDAHDPIKAIAHDRCIAIPLYPDLPDKYDEVSQTERADILAVFLQQVIKNARGAKLRELRSSVIEAWLA